MGGNIMELILQKNLPHQQRAVDAINNVFEGVAIAKPRQFYENPTINLSDSRMIQNIKALQNDIPSEYKSNSPISDVLNLDIKMETGERVIIVMGAVCVIKSRVSGTLDEYISCIA